MNSYKGDMSPEVLCSHMSNLCKNYDPDAADAINAMYGSYVKGEDVEVTTASRLFAQSTFTKQSVKNMKDKETSSKKQILWGYTSVLYFGQSSKE